MCVVLRIYRQQYFYLNAWTNHCHWCFDVNFLLSSFNFPLSSELASWKSFVQGDSIANAIPKWFDQFSKGDISKSLYGTNKNRRTKVVCPGPRNHRVYNFQFFFWFYSFIFSFLDFCCWISFFGTFPWLYSCCTFCSTNESQIVEKFLFFPIELCM